MKLITRETDYAVRALCFIARSDKTVVPVSDLAKTLKIPKPFLRKILQILNKKRILKSYKGKGGGFMLGVKPSKISLLNLVEIYQGPFELNKCMFTKRVCPKTKICKLKKKLDKLQENVINELKSITLASLINKT